MTQYSIEPRTRKNVRDMVCCHLREIFLTKTENNYWIHD